MAESQELVNHWQYRYYAHTCSNCKMAVEARYHCTICGEVGMCYACYEKDSLIHKLEKLGIGLDEGSTTSDHTEAEVEERHTQCLQRFVALLVHACQCRDASCRECQRMERVVQHAQSCKRRSKYGCCICRQLIALCGWHARQCQEVQCSVPSCTTIKYKKKYLQQPQTLQKALSLTRRTAAMQNRSISDAAHRSRPGNSSSSSERYPRVQQHSSSFYPPETHFGIIYSRAPPVGGLQAVHQVQVPKQTECNTALQMMFGLSNYKPHEDNVDFLDQNHRPDQNPKPLSPPDMRQATNLGEGSGTMANSVGHSATGSYPQVVPNSGPSRGGTVDGWQQLLQVLKSPPSEEQRQQVLAILKSNPRLMAIFIKQRTFQLRQMQQQQ